MELQRDWLATYLDEREARAARARHSVFWRLVMSIVNARSLWIAAFGVAAKWWRQHRARAT